MEKPEVLTKPRLKTSYEMSFNVLGMGVKMSVALRLFLLNYHCCNVFKKVIIFHIEKQCYQAS